MLIALLLATSLDYGVTTAAGNFNEVCAFPASAAVAMRLPTCETVTIAHCKDVDKMWWTDRGALMSSALAHVIPCPIKKHN